MTNTRCSAGASPARVKQTGQGRTLVKALADCVKLLAGVQYLASEGIVERFHRYYSLHRILSSRRLPVPCAAIEHELECSRATVSRVIDDLRGYGAPIEYLREPLGGTDYLISYIV